MNGTTEDLGEVFLVPNGVDPAVVAEYMKQTGASAEKAAADIENLGRALLDQELSKGEPGEFTNRAARRARERAERKRR